jgi:hypothetical protein
MYPLHCPSKLAAVPSPAWRLPHTTAEYLAAAGFQPTWRARRSDQQGRNVGKRGCVTHPRRDSGDKRLFLATRNTRSTLAIYSYGTEKAQDQWPSPGNEDQSGGELGAREGGNRPLRGLGPVLGGDVMGFLFARTEVRRQAFFCAQIDRWEHCFYWASGAGSRLLIVLWGPFFGRFTRSRRDTVRDPAVGFRLRFLPCFEVRNRACLVAVACDKVGGSPPYPATRT